jgi:L-alanine-DL-glutamate epimerase-like enolase superfamily enzyme
MTITGIAIYRYSIPMVPFTIATGTMDYAQNVFIRVCTDENITGVGECSAFPMIAGETQDTCMALAKNFAQIWLHKNALDIDARLDELDAFIAANYTVKSAFDMALYDIAAKHAHKPLYAFLGGKYFEPQSDITIGIGEAGAMAQQAIDFVQQQDAAILKVKLGKNAAQDIQRIKRIREAVGNNIQIRIDANQGWSFEDALFALKGMEAFNIQFCEQPMRKWNDKYLPLLRSQTSIPIMADESVFTHHDAERLIEQNACDSVNIKFSKAGGIRESLAIHKVCKQAGIPNMIGGMLESRLALSAKVHFALACDNVVFYDLDTCLLGHKTDPVINGAVYDKLKLKLPGLPGVGADVDEAFLSNCEQFVF